MIYLEIWTQIGRTLVMNRRLPILAMFVLMNCTSPETTGNPHVGITTRFGDIEVELYSKQAPVTVAAFLSYIDSGFYEQSSFYRVLRDEDQPSNAPKSNIVQGGIWKANPRLLQKIPGVPHETTAHTKLSHTDGAISLARQAPGTAQTEFFICIGDQRGYDFGGENNADGQGYAAFGKVVKGMEVVNRIYAAPQSDGQFTPQIHITRMRRL
jgi:peptidyl-prolyl cis-trans isomerase A (cyclophilin A)